MSNQTAPSQTPQIALTRAEQQIIEVASDPILKQMLEQEYVESQELDSSMLWRLLAYLRHHPVLAASSAVISIFDALLMALPAYAVGLAIDVVRQADTARTTSSGWSVNGALHGVANLLAQLLPSSQGPQQRVIISFGLVILLCWTVHWAVAMTSAYLVQRLGQVTVHALRLDVYRHITQMDLGFFHTNPVGRLVNRTTFDTQSLSEFFSDAFAQGLRDLLFICVLVVVMLSMDLPLALIILASLPPLIFCAMIYRQYVRPAMRTTTAVLSRFNAWLAENIAGMRENQLYMTPSRRRAEVASLTDAHQASVTRWIRAWGLLRPVMMAISAIATAAILFVGYDRVISGAISVGVLLTFIQYTTKFWVPVRNLSEKFTVIQTALTATERIFDVLETPSAMTDAANADPSLKVSSGALSFQDVHFTYPKTTEVVLSGISFEAKAGEMIALVGDTGAGKSTIAHLTSRFYDATQGQIFVDGHNIQDYTLRQLRQGMALVPQDVVIFAGSIRDNITLGLEVSDELVQQAIEAVCADRIIARFELGLLHPMDEGGRTLSAGERQLISFARALVFNPPILILDEATANVDTETESLIQRALERLTQGRTSIVIAHRLSTIRNADQILVLRHGQIIERGRHEHLLTLDGEYSRLHQLHMSAAQETPSDI